VTTRAAQPTDNRQRALRNYGIGALTHSVTAMDISMRVL
jgi:nicotinate-nucleotide pyrophosphorylase